MRDDLVYVCEICQTVLEEHHCKAVCPNCGRMFDCSDLPLIRANGTVNEASHQFTARPGADPRDLLPQFETENDSDEATEKEETSSSDGNLP